jgi:hypothetical protein
MFEAVTANVARFEWCMRILITATFAALLAITAQARTPEEVSPKDIGPASIQSEALWQWPDPIPGIAATRPWLMQVTFLYTSEKPLLGGGDRFASRENCEVARWRLGSEVFGGTQRMSRKPIGIVVNCVFTPQ